MNSELHEVKAAVASDSGTYVPDFAQIAEAVGISPGTLDYNKVAQVPMQLFKLLLTGWLIHQKFDETTYLQDNADVAQAVRDGKVESGWSHYLSTGYYEGRKPGNYFVDPKFYRRTYLDVALAERKGLTTASAHYNAVGRAEQRDPCEAHAVMARLWRQSLTS